jgi:hypothetical protein
LTSFFRHLVSKTTFLKRNNTPSGHRFLRHHILSAGSGSDTTQQTLHSLTFFSGTLLRNLADLLRNFLLSHAQDFLLALLSDCRHLTLGCCGHLE